MYWISIGNVWLSYCRIKKDMEIKLSFMVFLRFDTQSFIVDICSYKVSFNRALKFKQGGGSITSFIDEPYEVSL